jgi:hypothetical protein
MAQRDGSHRVGWIIGGTVVLSTAAGWFAGFTQGGWWPGLGGGMEDRAASLQVLYGRASISVVTSSYKPGRPDRMRLIYFPTGHN